MIFQERKPRLNHCMHLQLISSGLLSEMVAFKIANEPSKDLMYH